MKTAHYQHKSTADSADLEKHACLPTFKGWEIRKRKIKGPPPFVVVHNPLAEYPLPEGYFPGAIEYRAEKTGANGDEIVTITPLTPPSAPPRNA